MILDLLYPPKCLHCDASLPKHQLLCCVCLDLFTLLSAEGHCSKCFGEIGTVSGICKPCREMAHPFARLSACFDGYGPAGSIARALLSQNQFHFAKDIASFIVIQMERLKYPPIDLLTIVPGYFFNRHQFMAKELALMLNIPFKHLLKRHLTPNPTFSPRKKCNIINQKVLLLDISMKTRTTIRSAGLALERSGAETIYGMTFCATY
ncbi:MAG: ComF family protein [Verrucomicrobia bacterium]|nr:ComF family protein [Verrucomicrobiota bacterium]